MQFQTPLELINYDEQKKRWPSNGNFILAQYDENSIVVYQAYKASIAEQLVLSQNYHSESCAASGLSMNRMTWIKPNFLWMMYRSGWATKKDQEHIMAIRITRKGFEEILSKAVLSRKAGDTIPVKNDAVRLQWDPDHEPNGDKVANGRRAIQLGLRDQMFMRFSTEFILRIDDITDFVVAMRKNIDNSEKLMVPVENVYYVNDPCISQRISLQNENKSS